MTKNTDYSTIRSSSIKRPAFSIVYIAYSEVSVMSGSKDQSSSYGRNGSCEGAEREGKEYECMSRIAKIPLIESTASVMSNFYSSVKQSHSVVQTMFENVEKGWGKSTEAVSPVTAKIGETLERPLRVMDSAACVSLDYLEEKIPSVKLPPEQIYEKSKDYLNHQVLSPVVNFSYTLLENLREKVSQYAKSLGVPEDKDNGDNCNKNADAAKNNK